MSIFARVLPDNPVLTKELRARMRGARAYWILLGYLGFLSLTLLLNYAGWLNQVQKQGAGASEASRVGADIFNWILVTQVFLALFITPAITSGAISIEREQRTLDMLAMTPLSRRSIVAGKLLSAVLFTALLLISSLPIVSICFLLGSVDPGMVATTYLMLLTGSFLVGALGLMWSSLAASTSSAVLSTYATLVMPVYIGFAAWVGMQRGAGDLRGNLWRCLGETWFGSRFLGVEGPAGLGFMVMSTLGGILFAAIAVSRLENQPERRAPLLRGLTLLIVGTQTLSFCLWWIHAWVSRGLQVVQTAVQPPIAALILVAFLVMFVTPIFATGEIKPEDARDWRRSLASGWKRQELMQGKLASGLPFLLLFTLCLLGLYGVSFALFGRPGDAFRNLAGASAPLSGAFPQAAMALLASAGGFALLCLLLSVVCRNRWVAMGLAYLFLALFWIAPDLTRSATTVTNSPGISLDLYYLNPAQSLVEMSLPPADYWYHRPLRFGETPMWQVTTLVWLSIGVVSLALVRLAPTPKNRGGEHLSGSLPSPAERSEGIQGEESGVREDTP